MEIALIVLPGCIFADCGPAGRAFPVPYLAGNVCRCCCRAYYWPDIDSDAARSVNVDVMVFLFGMFIVGEALSESGYLFAISQRMVSHCKNSWQFIVLFIFSMALLAAFFMNDTIAIIGTPLALYLGRRFGLSVKMLLLSLCFAITTGSVLSPIGNPQNLLIATSGGYGNPFGTFLLYLGVPTVISLLVLVLFIRLFYPWDTGTDFCKPENTNVADPELALILKISLVLIASCIILQVLLTLHPFGLVYTVPLPAIAIAGAAPIVLLSRKRAEIIRKIDWSTLVFFVSMFVLMAAVFTTGFFQAAVPAAAASSVVLLFSTSLIISQFISNVPFVALFNPLLQQAGMSVNETMALVAGSTLAGNLTILGAASNIIVIQNAERQGETITFMEFIRLGFPFTIITGVIFVVWLSVV